MINSIDEFESVRLRKNEHYLRLFVGEYEVTIEPHIITGFTIGLFHKDRISNNRLAIRKRAVWKANHPTDDSVPQKLEQELERLCVKIANELLDEVNTEKN